MAKNYAQIVIGFQRTLDECTQLTEAILTKETANKVAAAKLSAKLTDLQKERNQTTRLAKKLTEFIGE